MNREFFSILYTSYLLLFLILVAPVLVFSQSGDTVFTVKMPAQQVSVLPLTDFLYKNVSNKFTLVKPATTTVDSIVFIPGGAVRKDSVFIIKPSKTGTALLKIYASPAGKKTALVFTQEYAVRTFVEPKPNLDGVESDSALYRMRVVAQGYVNVPLNTGPELKRLSHKIVSFEMHTVDKGRMDTLKTSGNRLTFEMRDRIDKMQDGNVIRLSDIKYLVNEDTFTIREPLRVFLINDKVNRF